MLNVFHEVTLEASKSGDGEGEGGEVMGGGAQEDPFDQDPFGKMEIVFWSGLGGAKTGRGRARAQGDHGGGAKTGKSGGGGGKEDLDGGVEEGIEIEMLDIVQIIDGVLFWCACRAMVVGVGFSAKGDEGHAAKGARGRGGVAGGVTGHVGAEELFERVGYPEDGGGGF